MSTLVRRLASAQRGHISYQPGCQDIRTLGSEIIFIAKGRQGRPYRIPLLAA
jgi:hypothetical protein